MKRTLFCLLVSTALLGWSCSSVSVNVDYDRDTDFTQYKTYRWMPQQQRPPEQMSVEHSFLEKRIKDAVEAELRSAGYERARFEEPDFLIAYHLGTRDKVDVSRYGYRYGPKGRWVGSKVEVRRYREGTLILDFIDPGTRDLFWRGTARGALRDITAGADEVRGIVARILGGFPPSG